MPTARQLFEAFIDGNPDLRNMRWEGLSEGIQAGWDRVRVLATTPIPTREEHEANAQRFIGEMERFLLEIVKIATGPAVERVFERRNQLVRDLRDLFRDEFHRGAQEARRNMGQALRGAIDYEVRQ